MQLPAGASFAFTLYTRDGSGRKDADALPVGTVKHMGMVDSAVAVNVTQIDTGEYVLSGTLPSTGYSAYDVVEVVGAATVDGISLPEVVGQVTIAPGTPAPLDETDEDLSYEQGIGTALLGLTPSGGSDTVGNLLIQAAAGGQGGGGSATLSVVYLLDAAIATGDAPLALTQNDNGFRLRERLLNPDGSSMNLTGKTVTMALRAVGGSTPIIKTATIILADEGQAEVTLSAADLATPGSYRRKWTISDGSGDVASYPETGGLPVTIVADTD